MLCRPLARGYHPTLHDGVQSTLVTRSCIVRGRADSKARPQLPRGGSVYPLNLPSASILGHLLYLGGPKSKGKSPILELSGLSAEVEADSDKQAAQRHVDSD
jgi:hypothetical protein